jgi:hypothetical protein
MTLAKASWHWRQKAAATRYRRHSAMRAANAGLALTWKRRSNVVISAGVMSFIELSVKNKGKNENYESKYKLVRFFFSEIKNIWNAT